MEIYNCARFINLNRIKEKIGCSRTRTRLACPYLYWHSAYVQKHDCLFYKQGSRVKPSRIYDAVVGYYEDVQRGSRSETWRVNTNQNSDGEFIEEEK